MGSYNDYVSEGEKLNKLLKECPDLTDEQVFNASLLTLAEQMTKAICKGADTLKDIEKELEKANRSLDKLNRRRV